MKLGIIDNGTDCLSELQYLCQESNYDFDVIAPQSAATVVTSGRYDIAILTGGFWYEDPSEWYRHYGRELESITSSDTPLLGICLGMQIIALAFGTDVSLLSQRIQGDRTIYLTNSAKHTLDWPSRIQVYENHDRGILQTPPDFEMLGWSDDCLEIMYHNTRPIAGVQFHPQLSRSQESFPVWRALIHNLTSQHSKHFK